MDRRRLISTGIALAGSSALAGAARAQQYGGPQGGYQQGGQPQYDQPQGGQPQYGQPQYGQPQGAPPQGDGYQGGPNTDHGRYDNGGQTNAMPSPDHGGPNYKAETFSQDELVNRVSDFFGVTAENAGSLISRIFADNGRPTGYIAGQEGAGAFAIGLRYGSGLLYMKRRDVQKVFWQGPSFGWDVGGNASRVFTLCYDLQYPDMIYRRFPGVEGSAYFIGGLGVNYQRADDITLAPIRAGVGLRLGANIGYLAYSRQRNIIPL